MSNSYNHLLKPGRIGKLSVKNRMVVTAMGVNLAEADGTCGERIRAFHTEHAKGGAGLVVLGVAGVAWPNGGNQPRQVAISDDRFIPGLKALADSIHEHGARLAIQLHHAGLVAAQDRAEGRPLWVPSYPSAKQGDFQDGLLESELASMFAPDAPPVKLHVMSREDIAQLVQQFAAGADRAKRAGADGIEIHGAHGYIISEFLSPQMNQRDDEYGGSLENRARLLIEIIRAVRARVGEDFPLWCKLDSAEFGAAEGISLEDAIQTARLVEQAGADAITVSSYHNGAHGWLHSESNIPFVPERMVDNAKAIRAAIGIPVIASGRIEADAADRHIEAGHFDFLALGRKLLADPHLPRKIAEGRAETVRPCVYCYCCVSQIYVLKPVKCAVNPEAAFERERVLLPAPVTKRVAVIGGGPAGMEAARRLSIRGHRVTLLEQGDCLGGTLRFAALAYTPNAGILNWLKRQIAASSVDVRLNTPATPQLLRALQVDEVVVATGALRELPPIPGAQQSHVFSGDEMRSLVLGKNDAALRAKTSLSTRLITRAGALSGMNRKLGVLRAVSRVWMPLGQRIVIVGGELVGLELAEFLAHRGREVTVIEEGSRSGRGLYLVRRLRLLHELRELGVTLLNRARDIAIGKDTVSYVNYRGQQRHVAADHVIVAQGARGDDTLAQQLRAEGFTVHAIGDSTGVGYIEGAMESAAELAVRIGNA